MLIIFVGLGASRNPTRWLLQKSVNPGMKDADNSYDNPAGNCQSSCRRTPDPAITIVCKTAWKNVQGIGENSVKNCPP